MTGLLKTQHIVGRAKKLPLLDPIRQNLTFGLKIF